jgi:hypothetical protein
VIQAQKPKPEPEPEKPEARESEPEPEPEKDDGPVRLILNHPYDIARTFVRLAEDKEGKKRYVFVGKVEDELIRDGIGPKAESLDFDDRLVHP